MAKATKLIRPRTVTGDGEGLVSHAGLVWLGDVADRSGLTVNVNRRVQPGPGVSAPRRRHDPGVTLVQLAIVSTVTVTFKKQGGSNPPMRPLRYSINVTLDGCCDHRVIPADEESHRYWAANLERADALLFGRVTYEMMEEAWRQPATGTWPDWMADWMIPFARTIDGAKKYVVSGTLDRVDWNAELVQGDLEKAVQQLKREPGKGLFVGGVTLPLALADLGLIDEYEFVVQPILAGHGPTLFAGLSERLELRLVGRQEFRSGAVALRYQPSRVTA